MLITGKKRPFRFVLKQENSLERGKNGLFHIKTLCVGGEGEASPWFALRCSPPPRLRALPLKTRHQQPTAPEMCSSRSHGFGLRPLMFAQRHIFFRLRAFISGCLAALDAAPPFPARVMPMEIGISFSCPKKSAPAQPTPHEPKDRSSYASLPPKGGHVH